ncbi:hypothetical protein [Prosthecobacter sp.]|uniref:hypothetical protein n=1 Tax=Prosthecobacter sp. TaxID=1965333 RepID=UPI003783D0C7
MKQLIIQIDGATCKAMLFSESGVMLAEDEFTMQHGTHSWSYLQREVHDRLQLHAFAPPGMPTESGRTCGDPFRIWQVVCCGIPGAPGWGWGFMLPLEHVETCCGFADEDSAAKAAKALQLARGRISGDLPGGVYEVFQLDDAFAFFDAQGELHATFQTAAEARGCAAKMDANHTQNEQPSSLHI